MSQAAAQLRRGVRSGNIPSRGKEPLWTGSFFAIALINLFTLGSADMLIPTFPFYIKHLGGSELTVGIAASLFSLASLVMRPVAGWLLDHKGRKGIFYIGVLGIIAVTLVYPLVSAIPLLIALRTLHGGMSGSANTSASTNACDIVPRSRFAEGIGMFGLTNSIAMALGPALGNWVMEDYGFTNMFYVCAACAGMSLLCLRFLHLKPLPQKAASQKAEGFFLKRILKAVIHKDALPAAVVVLLAMIPGGCISSFIALYVAEAGLGSGPLFFLVLSVGTASARLFSGRITDRHGEGPMVYLSTLLALVCQGMIVMGRGGFPLYFGALCGGLSYGMLLPAMQTMAVRIVPAQERGAASSTYMCLFDIGWGGGGLLGGVFATLWGYRAMFSVMTLGLVFSVLLYYFWARRSRSALSGAREASPPTA